jgi:phosphoribosylaminoimidazolecarboxamide formyltransferase/IMP cyclohydrolase
LLALLSVSDKRGLVPFARGLTEFGFTLLSTSGTLKVLEAEGISVKSISDYTGSPEILGGRVKTLHPRVHGGILARPDSASDRRDLEQLGIQPISLVAVNLYPFRQAVISKAAEEDAVEQIDIGGPALVRAAAKNFAHVTVIVDPADYGRVLEELRGQGGAVPLATRRSLMRKAFAHTAAYDASIASHFSTEPFPDELTLSFRKEKDLRYGENPHQRASFFREYLPPADPSAAFSRVIQGKELSFNNLLDLDAALALLLEFPEQPCAVIVKHNTPCGVAWGADLAASYRLARAVDEVSAFGGIVGLNREVDEPTASALGETFLEAVIAPAYSPAALSKLSAKKNLRLLETREPLARNPSTPPRLEFRSIVGGLLIQDRDQVEPAHEWKVVTERAPRSEELQAMQFAWRVCKHVKSNAIVFAAPDRLLAVGGGQTSRVDAVKIAVGRGGPRLQGSSMASDAFFPFRDGVDEAALAGVTAVVQPGGSVRDAEVIAAANEHGMAMVFTGVRHFRH